MSDSLTVNETVSVLEGEKYRSNNPLFFIQKLINGHEVIWSAENPLNIQVIKNNDPITGIGEPSNEFLRWEENSVYKTAGFFVKENGVTKFAEMDCLDLEFGEIHAKAMVEIWNTYTDKQYTLIGEGIGWASCKGGVNELPPGVELKDVYRFYLLDELGPEIDGDLVNGESAIIRDNIK